MVHAQIVTRHRGWTAEILSGLIVAASIAVIINLPLWHALATTDEWQWNDVVPESSDELFYLAGIREVVDGHPSIGNPYHWERRDQDYPLGNLWEHIVAVPMQIFDVRIKTMSILMDALFPFIIVLLAWLMLCQPFPLWRWRGIAIGLLFLAGNLDLWKRPISPQATFLLALLWMLLFLGKQRGRMPLTILRSCIIGIMVYSYPFHWTYAVAAEAVLWMWNVIERRAVSREALMRAAAIALPFLLIASRKIVSLLAVVQRQEYAETMSRLGLIARRLPVGPVLQLQILFCIAIVLFIGRGDRGTYKTPLLALLFGGLVVLWQPMVTGQEAEFAGHYGYILFFPLVMAYVYALQRSTRCSVSLSSVVLVGAAMFLIGSTWIHTERGFMNMSHIRPTTTERRALQNTIDVLQTLPKESVILTENSFVSRLVVSTSHYPFTSYEAYMYMAPDEEIIARALVYNALVPYEKLSPRGVFGTRYENQKLYARVRCSLGRIFGIELQACSDMNECRACDEFDQLPPPSDEEILSVLTNHHVEYVLLKHIPHVLKQYLRPLHVMADNRTLYLLELPR